MDHHALNYDNGNSAFVQAQKSMAIDTFTLPKAELAGGRVFTLKNRYIDGMEIFELNTDMVVSCEDMQDIARRDDSEGDGNRCMRLKRPDQRQRRESVAM